MSAPLLACRCLSWNIVSGFALAAFYFLFPGNARGASVPEPATVFYGKVIGTGSAQPFLVTEGSLSWTVKRSDGTVLALQTALHALNNGEYSYRLDIPHQVLGPGLTVSDNAVPLSGTSERVNHLSFSVNGKPAVILAGASSFDSASASRAVTYRMDLKAPLIATDSDGDGIPDWWMKKYGLASGATDPDGDGRSSAQEYVLGTDPTRSNKQPYLATRSLEVFAGATTQLGLEVTGDFTPDRVQFAITKTSSGGTLYLRNATANPESPDLPLSNGSTFSLKDVNDGRLIFTQTDGQAQQTDLSFAISDGGSLGSSSEASVTLSNYAQPASVSIVTDEQLIQLAQSPGPNPNISASDEARIRAWGVAKLQHAIVAGAIEPRASLTVNVLSAKNSGDDTQTYVARFGADKGYAILAGASVNTLAGGLKGDSFYLLSGDSTITGNGGGDRFVFYPGSAKAHILGFNPVSGDVIDLRKTLSGQSKALGAYVRVTRSGDDSVLLIDANGDGSGFTDLTINVSGTPIASNTLEEWIDSGALVVGDLNLPVRVDIASTLAHASENDLVPGEVSLSRGGSLASELTVSLEISGDAQNGVDYASIPSQVTFAAGDKSARISIKPLADNVVEPLERATIRLIPASGYAIGGGAEAAVTIEDRAVLIKLEALENYATQTPESTGLILVRREGIVDRSVLVRLDIAGTAIAGVDYASVSKYVNLAANETTKLIEIKTLPGAKLGSGKSVTLTALPDSSYLVRGTAPATVTLLARRDSFAAWRTTYFPASSLPLSQFAAEDAQSKGVANLWRYALGLDPLNPDRSAISRTYVKDGYLMLEIPLRPEAVDVELAVSVSHDLLTWDNSPQSVERLPSTGGLAVVFRVLPPLQDQPKAFVNLSLTLKP